MAVAVTASSVTLREAPGIADRGSDCSEDPLGVFEASAISRSDAMRSPSRRVLPPPPLPPLDSAALDWRREQSPVKRPWGKQQRGDSSSQLRQRSASPAKVGDDLLGPFHASSRRESSPRDRHGGQPAGGHATGSSELAGLGKYWSRDSQGRPFRLPFKPTERDLQKGVVLDRRIADFVADNGLEDRVGRIMKNMLPDDVERVLDEGAVPGNCMNPNAVVVARVRRVERAMQRPNAMKRYDKDGTRPHSPSPCALRRSRSRSHQWKGRGTRGRTRASWQGGGPWRRHSGRGRRELSGSSRSCSR